VKLEIPSAMQSNYANYGNMQNEITTFLGKVLCFHCIQNLCSILDHQHNDETYHQPVLWWYINFKSKRKEHLYI